MLKITTLYTKRGKHKKLHTVFTVFKKSTPKSLRLRFVMYGIGSTKWV